MASGVGTGWAAGNQILLVWLQLPLNTEVSGGLEKSVGVRYHLVTAGNREAKQTQIGNRRKQTRKKTGTQNGQN